MLLVVARISYDQVACYTFTSTANPQPGGVFEVRTTTLGINEPFPCTQTFDVELGVLPQGNYSVLFYVSSFLLASTALTVGARAVPIPAIGPFGIALLAMTLALVAALEGRRRVGRARPRPGAPSQRP